MASSGSADEDFQSRVAKSFGSLAFSRSSSSAPASRQQSSSVWTLSGADVEKREWKRDSYDRDEMPCASSFDNLLRNQRISTSEDDLKDLDSGEGFDGDWSIRASIGLDSTLDHEAEEDEFDKVALGEEDGGESLSMEYTFSFGRIRDPRANLVAAKIRLKEDEIDAQKVSNCGDHTSKRKEASTWFSEAVPPKPILRRKENSSDSEARASKRVRFDVVYEEPSKQPEHTCSPSASSKGGSLQGKSGAQVPDYLLHPSKYTRYCFDPSYESNEEPTTQEHMDIPKAVEGLETSESVEKVAFVPQKKTNEVREDSSNSSEKKPMVPGQVAEDDERPDAGEEDADSEIAESERCTSFQRNGRQYRAKLSLDETDV